MANRRKKAGSRAAADDSAEAADQNPPAEVDERSALLIRLLIAAYGEHQVDFARAAKIGEAQMSRYRSGLVVPRRKTLLHLAATAKVKLSYLEAVTADILRYQGRMSAAESPTGDGAIDRAARLSGDLGSDLADRLAPRAEALEEAVVAEIPFLSPAPYTGPAAADREAVPALWQLLEPRKPDERIQLVDAVPELRSWALAEFLGEKSVRRAVHDPHSALGLAELALHIAERVPGSDGWRLRNQGLALGYRGNARRVLSDLPAAELDFLRAWELFNSGAADDPGLLDESRLFDLEASLCIAHRREAATFERLDRARALARTSHAVGRVLLIRSFALEQFGRRAEAIPFLQEALALLEEAREPRCVFGALFNLTVNLLELGRLPEAEKHLPDIRARAARLGLPHDLLRLRWLDARFDLARGYRARGMEALESVRAAFAEEKLPYDVALVALELAALHLDLGGNTEARALAEHVLPIFKTQGVRREALAAVRLFLEATQRETATAEVARQALEALRQGRG